MALFQFRVHIVLETLNDTATTSYNERLSTVRTLHTAHNNMMFITGIQMDRVYRVDGYKYPCLEKFKRANYLVNIASNQKIMTIMKLYNK